MNYLAVVATIVLGLFISGCSSPDRRDADQTPPDRTEATIEERVFITNVKMEDDDGKLLYHQIFYSYEQPKTDWETGELVIIVADTGMPLRIPIEFEWMVQEGMRTRTIG
tara:strand:+ start:121824 stop:122153 length:330 start_codon:yes stop_codon:yes gene_type:complete